jgi:hypothetical protein
MQLPAISSLVSLLSTSVGGLKDLYKPNSLVAAAYFALLHLVLIFPPVRDGRFLPVVAFERLPTVWQVVLGTFILFTLAYVLTVMAQSFLNLVNGQALQDHVPELAAHLRRRQIKRFNQLKGKIKREAGNENWKAEDAADRLAYEFPDEERDIAPTRLGNILLSPASYTYRQYGARLDTIWPILVRKVTDEELRKQITGEMEAITFLATMSVLSVLLALEMFLVVVWFGDSWWSVVWFPVLLLVATVFYYVTFPKARAWGLGIRTAFDQHLDLAADALGLLGLKELTDPLEKQQRWRDVSAWLSIGALRKPSPNMIINTKTTDEDAPLLASDKKWYRAAAPLTVKYPPNVTVSPHSEVIAKWSNMTLFDGQAWRLAGQEIVYIIAVTNQGEEPVIGTSLQIVDTRLPALPVKVFGTLGPPGGSRLEGLPLPANPDSPQPQTLLWFLQSIPAGETQVLRYQVRSDYSICITQGKATIIEDNDKPNQIILKPTDAVTFSINVMNQSQLAPLYDTAGNPLNRINRNWSEIETEHQATKSADFQAIREVEIHWDGQRFVPGR